MNLTLTYLLVFHSLYNQKMTQWMEPCQIGHSQTLKAEWECEVSLLGTSIISHWFLHAPVGRLRHLDPFSSPVQVSFYICNTTHIKGIVYPKNNWVVCLMLQSQILLRISQWQLLRPVRLQCIGPPLILPRMLYSSNTSCTGWIYPLAKAILFGWTRQIRVLWLVGWRRIMLTRSQFCLSLLKMWKAMAVCPWLSSQVGFAKKKKKCVGDTEGWINLCVHQHANHSST